MLSRTFLHLPGVGQATERKLWKAGVVSWGDFAAAGELVPAARRALISRALAESEARLASGDADWFAEHLPAAESWRLASHFLSRAAFVDIETTGLGEESHITAIALYDGTRARTYVHGVNLEAFADDIRAFDLLVTYNGRCFDAPFIERELKIRLPRAHIDLRHVLKSVGLRGGLKACEKQLCLNREELDGVDGYFAVILWHEFETTGNPAALETLLAYNVADVLSLPHLLVHGYNEKLAATPFAAQRLADPAPGENPHQADPALIERLKARYGLYGR